MVVLISMLSPSSGKEMATKIWNIDMDATKIQDKNVLHRVKFIYILKYYSILSCINKIPLYLTVLAHFILYNLFLANVSPYRGQRMANIFFIFFTNIWQISQTKRKMTRGKRNDAINFRLLFQILKFFILCYLFINRFDGSFYIHWRSLNGRNRPGKLS